MPMHDWTIVSPGTYHGFHTAWITEIARSLNNGILPEPFYTESEQIAGQTGPDVLALEVESNPDTSASGDDRVGSIHRVSGGIATLTETVPKVSVMQTASEAEVYSERRNRLAIRHTSGDRLVAYVELLSSGHKSSRRMLESFLDKACSVIEQEVHLLIVDPDPPGTYDPQGIHAAIWNEIDPSTPFVFPDDRRLTAVSYHAVHPPVAFVEPMAVGLPLPVMPLFLDSQRYLNLPLEPTYMEALTAVPKHYRNRLVQGINSGLRQS
jgi:hypothetical protein